MLQQLFQEESWQNEFFGEDFKDMTHVQQYV